MINVTRPAELPVSLQSTAIRDYIEALANHVEQPEEFPEPTKPPNYRNNDIMIAFDACFYSKCYLTEQKYENSWAMDIDHFISKNEQPELRYVWTNLYPADHKANMMKPRRMPAGGYLDPCADEDDVEFDLLYALTIDEQQPRFQARNVNNVKAINTAKLLNRLHNGENEDSQKNTLHLRFLIRKKYNEVLKAIIAWLAAVEPQEKFQAEVDLKRLLSRRASFTALMRSIPAVRHIPKGFLD